MSIDFYVVVSAIEWPRATAAQQCIIKHDYPIEIKRFPFLKKESRTDDGVLVNIDGQEAYLEGSLAPARLWGKDLVDFKQRIDRSRTPFQIKTSDVVMSIHTRSFREVRAASYVIASMILCYHGFGFETQGNTHGRSEFASQLVKSAEALKGI